MIVLSIADLVVVAGTLVVTSPVVFVLDLPDCLPCLFAAAVSATALCPTVRATDSETSNVLLQSLNGWSAKFRVHL